MISPFFKSIFHNGETKNQRDKLMDRQPNEWIDMQIDRSLDRWMDGCMYIFMDGWINGWNNGQMDL